MHYQNLAIVIVFVLGCVVGCDKTLPTSPPDDVLSWFQVYLYENENFVDLVGEGRQTVPGEWVKLKLPNHTEDALFRVLDVDRKSVKFAVSWKGAEKIGGTGNRHQGEVVFDENDGVLKFSVDAGGTVAPFGGIDFPLKDQFTVFQIQPRFGDKHDDKHIRGREIVESQSLGSSHAIAALNGIMSDPEQLSLGRGAECFDPHHAIRVENDEETIDVIVCFECTAIRVYCGVPHDERHYDYDEYVFRDDSQLKAFLAEYFPNDEQLTSSR